MKLRKSDPVVLPGLSLREPYKQEYEEHWRCGNLLILRCIAMRTRATLHQCRDRTELIHVFRYFHCFSDVPPLHDYNQLQPALLPDQTDAH